MKIKTCLFDSTTDDVAIVIDLLRASTTITVALNNFNKVIPVNNDDDAFSIKDKYQDVVLAGECDLNTIDGYDITNSPEVIRNMGGNILVINTTNGTKVLENIKNRNADVVVLVGASINAHALACKALNVANDEIELVMAGRHESFNIEDCIGAGLIIDEIIKVADDKGIDIELEELSLATLLLAEDKSRAKELIADSWGGKRLASIGLKGDVEICQELNTIDCVPVYANGEIIKG